ncbi:MAG TPA: cation transporter [Methylomirabilota bacterium]|nr:cation transporter [Methylomirabilota bacterium]
MKPRDRFIRMERASRGARRGEGSAHRVQYPPRDMAESRTAVTAALLGNAALAALKGTAAGFTGSAAILAETFHSIADTGNQVLLLVGMRLARRPPDRTHPFGHGKNVSFWSFVVSPP